MMIDDYSEHEGGSEKQPSAFKIIQNLERALTRKEPWESLWRDCYDMTLPELGRLRRAGESVGARAGLFDGTAPDAVDHLAASLLAQLTPPWGNWVGLGAGTDILPDSESQGRLNDLLAQSVATVQDQIDRSNLHTELHQCFLDLVIGGTAALVVNESPIGAVCAFQCQAVPLPELVLDQDGAGAPIRVYRHRVVRGETLLNRGFVSDLALLDLLSKEPDNEFEIIEFSEDTSEGFLTGVILIRPGQDPVFLRRVIRSASPYIVFRWMKTGEEIYGRSPVMKALPDIKTANKVVELTLKNASIAVTGIWQADDDGVLNMANIDLVPGAIIPKAVGSAGLKPLEMPARFDVSQLILSDLRARIRGALLGDRLGGTGGLTSMTATEIRERADETDLILGAVYGRLQSELLTPLVTRIYDLLRARGEIVDLPLDGRRVQILHRSPLARGQALRGLRGVSAWIAAVSQLGAAETLNTPEIARYLADALGVPEGLMSRPAPDSHSSSITLTSNSTQGELT